MSKELLNKWQVKKDTVEGVIKSETEGRNVNENKVNELHTVLRFVKEIVNDLKQLNKK